jgi:hypothetical protein
VDSIPSADSSPEHAGLGLDSTTNNVLPLAWLCVNYKLTAAVKFISNLLVRAYTIERLLEVNKWNKKN